MGKDLRAWTLPVQPSRADLGGYSERNRLLLTFVEADAAGVSAVVRGDKTRENDSSNLTAYRPPLVLTQKKNLTIPASFDQEQFIFLRKREGSYD